jgi:hypothetical protein
MDLQPVLLYSIQIAVHVGFASPCKHMGWLTWAPVVKSPSMK